MTPLLQQIAAFGLVALSVGYLAWRWRRRRAAATCDGCHVPRPTPPRRGVRPASLRVIDQRRG